MPDADRRPPRWRNAIALSLVAGLALGGLAGYAQALQPPDSFSAFTIPVPRAGDAGRFLVGTASQDGDELRLAPEATVVDFLVGPSEYVLDRDGQARRVRWVNASWPETQQTALLALDAETGNLVAVGRVTARVLPSLAYDMPIVPPADVPHHSQVAFRQTVRVRHGEPTPAPFCLFFHGFQGAEVRAGDQLGGARSCAASGRSLHLPPLAVRAEGPPGEAHLQGSLAGARIVASLAPDAPYPVQVAIERPHEPGRFDAAVLVRFSAGAAPDASSKPPPRPLPRPATAPRTTTGISDPDPELGLAAAFAWARDDVSQPRLRAFLERHADAFVEEALATRDSAAPRLRWDFVVAGGRERLPVSVTFPTGRIHGPAGEQRLPLAPQVAYPEQHPFAGPTPFPAGPAPAAASRLPRELATSDAVEELWTVLVGGPWAGLTTRGFSLRCETPACDHVALLVVGAEYHGAGTKKPAPGANVPQIVMWDSEIRGFALDDRGGFLATWRQEAAGRANLGFFVPDSRPGDPDLPSTASPVTPAWRLPTGGLAASAGLAALLVGLLYAAWPTAKSALSALVAGFSRLTVDQALHNPTRARILQLVEAEPGIHLRELERRLGTHRGTVTHHVQKLLQLGLLTAHASKGFTCYFRKGAHGRAAIAAAPLLKAEGARRVLAVIHAAPGSSGLQVAAACGLSPATVSYHAQRLAEVGLLRTERYGNERRLFPTELLAGASASSPSAVPREGTPDSQAALRART